MAAFTLTDDFPLATPHDALLGGRTCRRPIDDLPSRMARDRPGLARAGRGLRIRRLALHRARHAWLWRFLCAVRLNGLCAKEIVDDMVELHDHLGVSPAIRSSTSSLPGQQSTRAPSASIPTAPVSACSMQTSPSPQTSPSIRSIPSPLPA
jgi:hypothetical protein